jgi:hypothetical protein
MQHAFILTALLAACSAEHNFGEAKPSDTTSGGDGRIEVFPADGVTCEPMATGHSSTCGFRVNSVGEYDLRLMSMEIINGGENAGEKVFDNLRPADDSMSFPVSINTGESAEFILLASMTEEGSATGSIEILTNDGTVSDPSPGKIRIALSASAIEYGTDDTGEGGEESGGDDTGEADDSSSDTGGGDSSEEGSSEDTGA